MKFSFLLLLNLCRVDIPFIILFNFWGSLWLTKIDFRNEHVHIVILIQNHSNIAFRFNLIRKIQISYIHIIFLFILILQLINLKLFLMSYIILLNFWIWGICGESIIFLIEFKFVFSFWINRGFSPINYYQRVLWDVHFHFFFLIF